MSARLLIIDGNSILNRAYYGIKFLTNSEGIHTNGVYGFLNILLKFIDEENPNYICVAFDLKAPTFRHEKYAQYKANRTGMPDELAHQLPILKDLLKAMNITIIEEAGYEADDIIGTIAQKCEEENLECLIVTGDRDSLQLATDNTKIFLTVTKGGNTQVSIYDKEAVVDKYGILPVQFVEVKGLMGDTSDNIPGVNGIGEKTALNLIKEYKSIENIYKNIDNIKIRKNAYKNLKEGKEIALLSKELAQIDKNIVLDISINDCVLKKYNDKELLKILKWLEFKTIIQRLDLEKEYIEKENIKINSIAVNDSKTLEKMKMDINNNLIAYKIYTNRENYPCAFVFSFINKEEYKAYYVPFSIVSSNFNVIEKTIREIFENESIRKIGHNVKDDIVTLHSLNINLKGLEFDVMIGAYIINPSRNTYDISELSREYLNKDLPLEESFFGKGKNKKYLCDITENKSLNYATEQTSVLIDLMNIFLSLMEDNGQKELFYNVELPLVEVLAQMQIYGVQVDKKRLKEFSKELSEKIKSIEEKIYEIAGEEFNINSPKQLGIILFEKLNLPVIKKTKTGYSTNVEVLQRLENEHEIIEYIMKYRHLIKLKTTYADGLLSVINRNTGRIHSNFNQTVTVTGRISSTEPNLQNIPVRLDIGREIRKVFIAQRDDYVLIDADYSQIELRVLAHIADDPTLKDAFVNNQDIHTRTASEVFNVPMEEVTNEMRSRAKAVNFGIVYGIGDFSLGKDLGISRKEAKKYIDNYLAKYPNVKKYMHDIKEEAKEKGYVKTLFNRRRYIPELTASNFMVKSFGERVALNTPIQGTAADIIKIAMVHVYRELNKRKLKSRLILQVHDELIVETFKEELDEVKKIVSNQMTNAVNLSVPLLVDLNVGESWYDTK